MPSNALYRVLCVEDDEEACEMLSLVLKPHGIQVVGARSAAEAWLKMKDKSFDLYLLDGWLPEVSGFEFCRQIRETDSITPILFYSGAAYDADVKKGLAAGANAYVTKPDIEGLIKTSLDLIANGRAADAARRLSIAEPPAERWASNPFFSPITASL
jgi:CheY-like chemotaxis protein